MTVLECPHCENKEISKFLHLEDCVICRTIGVTEDGTPFVDDGDAFEICMVQKRGRLQCLACDEEFFSPNKLGWGDPRGVTP